MIFVIDDESIIRGLMRKLLEAEGYQVIAADDCTSARIIWEKHQSSIDLLTIDLMMPDGPTGKVLAEEFLRAKPSLKVIFASGYGFDQTVAQQNGIFFVQKPFDIPMLLNIIKTALGKK